jgi:type II secretion system protein H
MRRRGPAAASRGFTLIEILAVVAILALVAALTLPNLRLRYTQAARDQAASLAATLELARQRALATGLPSRMVLDLDDQTWWLEDWRPAAETSKDAAAQDVPPRYAGLSQVPLSPPVAPDGAFHPAPAPFGEPTRLRDDTRLESVRTAGGEVETGRAYVRFAPDGSAPRTEVALRDRAGNAIQLDVAPLADGIRIRYGAP